MNTRRLDGIFQGSRSKTLSCYVLAITGLLLSIIFAIGTANTSHAQQAQLYQEIKPLECVYTTTQTGVGLNTNSTCDNQFIPFVTKIIPNLGRPLLRGSFSAAKTIMLRIWIDGQWYTLGIDSRVTVNADEWTLDLTGLPVPFVAGTHGVMIEVETNDGLLLRNAEAATFEILPVEIPNLSSGVSRGNAPSSFFSTTMISPQTQVGGDLFNLSGEAPFVINNFSETGKDVMPMINTNRDIFYTLISVICVGITSAILYVFFRGKS